MYCVRNISYKYPDGTRALSDISLDIAKGEFIGLLGANGSGKTTLLRAMDKLLKGVEGSVSLCGVDIRTLSPREIYKKVGLVFQNPDDQLFAPTLFEDVAFGPTNMGLASRDVEERVLNALKEVELNGLERKSVHNLSFGQRKRACIAGLLAMGHEILLLDEPTAGLDPTSAESIRNIILEEREQGERRHHTAFVRRQPRPVSTHKRLPREHENRPAVTYAYRCPVRVVAPRDC